MCEIMPNLISNALDRSLPRIHSLLRYVGDGLASFEMARVCHVCFAFDTFLFGPVPSGQGEVLLRKPKG